MSFDDFDGYKSFDDLIYFNQSLDTRATEAFKENGLESGEGYCIGILGSEVRDENLSWSPYEIIVFVKDLDKFKQSNFLYELNCRAAASDDHFDSYVEVKSYELGFNTYFINDNGDDIYDTNLISPSRILTSKVIVGDENIRLNIAKNILTNCLDKKVISSVKSYIKECIKICTLGFQRRSGNCIVHIDYETKFLHYNGETHRGIKESTIRGIQNLLILKELKYCKENPTIVDKILLFPNDIVSRIETHFSTLYWLNESDKNELIKVYKRSIEIQFESIFNFCDSGFEKPFVKIKIDTSDIEMIQNFGETLKRLLQKL